MSRVDFEQRVQKILLGIFEVHGQNGFSIDGSGKAFGRLGRRFGAVVQFIQWARPSTKENTELSAAGRLAAAAKERVIPQFSSSIRGRMSLAAAPKNIA